MTNTKMNFYLIRNKQVPWGDYGNILVYGFISKKGNDIIVERIGPFIPSIYTYNKYVAMTDSVKREVDKLNLKGVNFIPTNKEKIIDLDWQEWNIDEKIPIKPKSGEPEDFILKGKHNELVSENMGNIWVIIPKETAKGIIDNNKKIPGEYKHISLDVSDWDGSEIFRTPQLGHVFCTENIKNVLESFTNDYLRYIPIETK